MWSLSEKWGVRHSDTGGGIGDQESELMAGVESLREMGSAMLRYGGGRGDRVSEHMVGVESLREMRSAVLRYRRR